MQPTATRTLPGSTRRTLRWNGSTGGHHLNFPGFHGGGQLTLRTTFGPNDERLIARKSEYGPTNLLRLNQNVSPIP
jgi:hypothetical protein